MRVAVLSDIHASLAALDAVLAAVPSVDAVWQLGDIVGYEPQPDEVVARLRDVGARGVRGNHDAAAVGGLEIESFNADARGAMEGARAARWSGRGTRSPTRPASGWPRSRSASSSRTSRSSTARRETPSGNT